MPARRVAILGSTGSIGVNALDVLDHLGPDFKVVALSGHSNADKLLAQIRQFRPSAVAVTDPAARQTVAAALAAMGPTAPHLYNDMAEMIRQSDADTVLAAVVGAAGLPAVFAAVETGKTLALANKESLVVAGSLLIPLARKHGVPILPVDSEHSAIFQASLAGKPHEIKRLILTASGGPFRNATLDQIENATLADALNHPTWRMGNKITIDSATMFNKGLELIEACWLFDLPPEKVDIVIHPESVVHSMVDFVDGNVLAQLSPPDMRTPIQYALTYPARLPSNSRKLDLTKAFNLHFHPPDDDRFPAMQIAREVARRGGTLGAVMNAANEAAVEAFTSGKIPFGMIWRAVRYTIDCHTVQPAPTLDDLLAADQWARRTAHSYLQEQAVAPAKSR
ncbi:MAG: 1-deoxy-D-xylulose-5-phosphate reductoisomerase [Phycisphaerae bacterium]